MKYRIVISVSIVFGLSALPLGAQDLKKIKITFNELPTVTSKAVKDLADIRKAEADFKFDRCASLAKAQESKLAEYGPWLRVTGLRCQRQVFEKSKLAYKSYSNQVAVTWLNSNWLFKGAHISELKQELIDGTLDLIESELKDKRKKAWANINKLTAVKEWLDHHELAQVYRYAGELSFAEQNSRGAIDYWAMSLREEPNRNLESRLKTIKGAAESVALSEKEPSKNVAKNLNDEDEDVASSEGVGGPEKVIEGGGSNTSGEAEGAKAEPPGEGGSVAASPLPEPTALELNVGSSEDEKNLYKRFKDELKAQNPLAALDDALTLIKKYSGGTKAQLASREVLNMVLGLEIKAANTNTADKFLGIKKDAVSRMRAADGQRLFDWASVLAAKGYYTDAVELSQNSLDQIGGQPISTRVLLLCAQSAYHLADFKKARELFIKLAREHVGTKAASEAVFRLGIISLREQKYAEAGEQFEKYLSLDNNSDFEASSLYWLWRAQQKLKSNRASDTAERLTTKYPLSYFGLRARTELAGGTLSFEKNLKTKIQITLQLTPNDSTAFDRYNTLALAGWYNESKAELAALPMPDSAEAKLVFAELWAHCHDYIKASELLLAAFQKNSEFVTLDAIRVIYPVEYAVDIKREASRYNIPGELVQALIKQESSYRSEVKSPAGAIGLMQLLPSTAREVALDMKIKMSDVATDLTKPQVNLKLGTNYLHRKLRIFDGQVPLALAAYNAGIGNIRSWLRSRQDLKDLPHSQTSQAETELWFDELPWAETSGYIKGILRNLLIYRLINQGQYTLTDPIWKFVEKSGSST